MRLCKDNEEHSGPLTDDNASTEAEEQRCVEITPPPEITPCQIGARVRVSASFQIFSRGSIISGEGIISSCRSNIAFLVKLILLNSCYWPLFIFTNFFKYKIKASRLQKA